MTRIGVLHDDVAALGVGLGACLGELDAAARRLRDVQCDEAAPPRTAAAVDRALLRLGRELEALAAVAADAARVVNRDLAEPVPAAGSQRPVAEAPE
jgi:hypothetical protein